MKLGLEIGAFLRETGDPAVLKATLNGFAPQTAGSAQLEMSKLAMK